MTDFTPRPTVYKGVQMRSRLEAGFAQWLDSWGFTWTYEPQAFASDKGQYLPDFCIENVPAINARNLDLSGRRCYVEVKPDVPLDLEALRRRMLIIHGSEPGSDLVLVRPGQQPLLATSNSWLGLTWIYDVTPGPEYHEYLILGMQPSDIHPWPHGYWKGQ